MEYEYNNRMARDALFMYSYGHAAGWLAMRYMKVSTYLCKMAKSARYQIRAAVGVPAAAA